jgi:cytochrome c5
MRNSLLLAVAGLGLAACAHGNGDGANGDDDSVANGESAFLEHCAGCHETGMHGAPRIGIPGEWQDRSGLWQAVLMDHARSGYYDMPARGGKTNLPDEVVNAAAEYMLEQTFPNRPKD